MSGWGVQLRSSAGEESTSPLNQNSSMMQGKERERERKREEGVGDGGREWERSEIIVSVSQHRYYCASCLHVVTCDTHVHVHVHVHVHLLCSFMHHYYIHGRYIIIIIQIICIIKFGFYPESATLGTSHTQSSASLLQIWN